MTSCNKNGKRAKRIVVVGLVFLMSLSAGWGTMTVQAQAGENEQYDTLRQRVGQLISVNPSTEDIQVMAQSMSNEVDQLQNSQLSQSSQQKIKKWLEAYTQVRESTHRMDYQQEKLQNQFLQENITFPVSFWEEELQRAERLHACFEEEQIRVLKVYDTVSVEQVRQNEDEIELSVYEWVFVSYEMNGKQDMMGYGLEHLVLIDEETGAFEDQYVDSFTQQEEEVCQEDVSQQMPLQTRVYLQNRILTGIRSVNTYQSTAAVAYADRYAINYNSSYSNYNSIGGDCANFVSQCLYAGGLPMTDDWFWYSYDNRTSSWSYCSTQVTYLEKNVGVKIENPSDSQVKEGNPVYYYSNTSGRYSHAAICVGTNSSGVPVVNAHNNDRYHVTWTLGSSWGKRCTIQIPAGEADTQSPVLSNGTYSNVTSDQFSVSCQVSDNVGVTTVMIAVWTEYQGQDDLVWYQASMNGSTASCTVSVAQHNYEGGVYNVNVYAYDAAGNQGGYNPGNITIQRDTAAAMKGDLNLNGLIDLEDAKVVLRAALGVIKMTADNQNLADFNGDQTVTLEDARAVLKQALGID